jgi:hypothetical protein
MMSWQPRVSIFADLGINDDAVMPLDALILSGQLDLSEVLRRKVRHAAETNRSFVPVREPFAHVT